MTDLPTDLRPLVLRGHVIDVLRSLPAESVQCAVTSPPYWGLRSYGTPPQTWGGDPAHAHEWATTAPRRSRSEDDVADRDSKQATSEGSAYEAQGGESCAGCGAWRGELGLEPTPELYVEHVSLVFAEVRRVLRKDGTLWLNLGDTYAAAPVGKWSGEKGLKNRDLSYRPGSGAIDKRAPGLKPKDLVGIPWRVAFRLQADGWWLRSDCVWAKPNPMPESVTDRPTRSHEYVFLLTKAGRYFYDADAVRTEYSPTEGGWQGRLARGELKDRGNYPQEYNLAYGKPGDHQTGLRGGPDSTALNHGGANLKTVWWAATQPFPEAHFATFPEEIAERCIRAGTSERGACATCGAPWERRTEATGGSIGRDWNAEKWRPSDRRAETDGMVARKASNSEFPSAYTRTTLGFSPTCSCSPSDPVGCLVLDPFAGSGTTLQVARRLGRRSVGIELKAEYVKLARRRASTHLPDIESFGDGRERADGGDDVGA